jgi:hypothetical protein
LWRYHAVHLLLFPFPNVGFVRSLLAMRPRFLRPWSPFELLTPFLLLCVALPRLLVPPVYDVLILAGFGECLLQVLREILAALMTVFVPNSAHCAHR